MKPGGALRLHRRLGALFLGPWGTSILALGTLAPIFGMLVFFRPERMGGLAFVFFFLVAFPLFVFVTSSYRRLVEKDCEYRLQVNAEQSDKERNEHARELEASLLQKDALLREIHHRVKNNLQIISSLLYMQFRRATSPELTGALTALMARIRAMVTVHERLYGSTDLSRVEMCGYLDELAIGLFRSFGGPSVRLDFAASGGEAFLDVDKAVSVGLIAAELVSNAFKHAFPSGTEGHITFAVEAEEGRLVSFSVVDDGVGLREGFDLERGCGMGMKIIGALARQVGARLQISGTGGAAFKIIMRPEEAGAPLSGGSVPQK